MKFGKTLMAAAAASAMMIGTASADWDGAYFGAFGGASFAPLGGPVYSMNLGLGAGFNFVPSGGNFLVGIRLDAGGSFVGPIFYLADQIASFRVGGFVSPDLLLYGTAGFGQHVPIIAPGGTASMLGVGAELALGTGGTSAFIEYRRYNIVPGGVPASAYPAILIGMNFNR